MTTRMQSSLGSRIKRVDKDDLIKGNLIFATVKSVNYQFQTAELEQSGAMNKVGSKGKFSVPIPREFIGRSPEGSLFGHSPLLAPGTKVLVGFVDGDRNSPVILSSYGKPSDNATLSPLPIKGGEFSNKGIYKYAGAIHKIFPSMTYEFIDGDGTQVKTYPGKTFLSIASKPDEKPSASDFYLGTSYSDLYSSRYGDEKLIEPRSQIAPNILFKHQGTHTAEGNEDTHVTMLGIDEKGAMRASVLDKKAGFRTTQEMDEKGNYRVVHQPNELILGETEDKLEFGINTESQTFYIRQGTKLYEFTDNGMTVDGKLPEDIIAEVVNNSEVGIINLIDDSERERGGEENPLYTIDLAPVFDLHGVDKPYSLSFELKTLSTKDRDDIKVYMGDGSSTKYSFVNKTVKASKEFTRITLEGIKPVLKDDSAKTAVLAFSGSFNNNNIPVVRMLKLEHGTKSSPWSPSNKDIESRVKVLGEEIVLDFADGIIDASELKRLKTHIEIMNRTYTDFEKRYEALINNPDFKDESLKASLVTAKNDFNKKSQVMIDTLLKVISDGVIEAVENEDTQRAFKDYDNAVAYLNMLIDDVIKTISVKMAGDLIADFEGVLGNVNSSIAKLQKQADGSIVTYYYSEDPTMFNKPAVEWDTEELKSMHVGDYYFNMSTGEAFEFFHDDKGYRWVTNDNQAIVKALEKASKAQDTADHKRRVFVTTPIPPYEIGDMWTQGTGGDIKVCKITRLTGKYDPADWGLASKYTDDSLASSALNVANTAQSNLDGFKKTVETVFRDGIIDEAESKQLQVHIDLMNRDKVELDNTYNKFMSDNEFTALPESSKLSLDKGQYDSAFKELFNIFNSAIQDKIIMPEETVNVSRAMSNYDNKLSTLKISLQNATQALVSVEASKQVKAFNGVIDDIINNYKELKIQADGVVNTYYYGYEPTVNNIPASNWTTTTEKNTHLGDYFMDTASGKVYIYTERNGNFTWEALTNQAVVDAISSAKDAQDTADNKRRIFTDNPYPPYDIGDMWVQGINGDIFVAKVSKSENTEFLISDWVKASKYTDDTKANEAKAKADMAYNSALLGISQAQDAQQKATTAYNNFNTFETSTFKAYQDGVISDIEKAKLNSQLSIIEVDCNKVIASTDEYLSNQYLPSQFKTTLTTYKNGLATAFEKLKNIYTTIVSDNKVTKEELSQSSTVLSDYQTALLNLVKETEKSNLAISKALTDNSIATFNNNISAVIGNINDIKNQVDGSINTYFYGYEPMLSNEPASAWNTIELKDTHVGDYFTDLSTGRVYKFTKSGSTYKWTPETNQAIVKAMSDAKNAQDTADGKRRVFAVQPIPPYDAGDMWTQGENGDILVATVGRVKGTSFNQSDWTKASKYTDDAKAVEAQRVAGQALSSASAVANNFSIFKETTFSAYQDKVISDFEKAQMKTQLDAIESDNAVLLAQYTDILASKYLEDKLKISLTNKKDLYVNAHSTLKSTINSAILNSKITASELETTRTAITNYTGKLAEFQVMIQKALANISDNTALNNIVSAVDKIEIGGVNLLEGSNFSKKQTPREHMYYIDILPTLNKVDVGDIITISFDVQMTKGVYLQAYNSNQRGIRYIDGFTFRDIGTNKKRLSFQAKVKEDTTKRTDLSTIEFYSLYDSGDFATVSNMKIEKGTKATGYNLAPEDYDNLIKDVRQETADVNDALGNFSNTVNTTFRDGIITETEAKKLTTAKKQLEREKAEMDSKYSALIALPNIDVAVKNELEARKKVFDITHKKSLDYMSSAIANKKISINEMNTLDNYLDEYKDNLSNLVISFEKVSDNNVDKKIDNLDLGVINLITTPKKKIYTESDISYKSPKSIVADGGWKEVTGVYSMPPEKDFVISGWAKIGSGTPGRLLIHPVQYDTETGTNRSASPVNYFLVGADWTYFEYKLKSAVNTKSGTVFIRIENTDSGNTILVNGLKLEMGTKATPWIPSHQDITNEITNANKNLIDYKKEISTTFRDGILDDAEYVRLKTISNEIDKDKIDNTTNVNDLKNNAYLTTSLKTSLTTLKTAYDNAHSDLQTSMSTVIADKKIDASENTLINSKLSAYNTALSNINTHIQKCLNGIADNMAKGRSTEAINGLEIGTRNLIYDSALRVKTDTTKETSILSWAYNILDNTWIQEKLKPNAVYTVSYEAQLTSKPNSPLYDNYTFGRLYLYSPNTTNDVFLPGMTKQQYESMTVNGATVKVSVTFTTPPELASDSQILGYTAYHKNGTTNEFATMKFKNIMLVEGNKVGSYQPAPEDIIAEVNNAKDSLANFEKYVKESFKDGIIDSTELVRLRTHKETLERNKKNLDTRYKNIYNNSNLTDTAVKTALSSSYSTFVSNHDNLMSKFSSAISNGKITTHENEAVMTALNAYDTALANLTTNIEKAIVSQGDSQLTQLTKLATTTSNNFADFKDNTFRAYSDNTLDTFEKQQLKAKLAVVTTNYKDLSKRYEDIDKNNFLSPEVKTTLTSTKTDFTKSYNTLIDSINTLLKSTKLTPTITQPVDNAMDNYQTAMSVFTVELQKALNDISNNQAIAKAKEAVDSMDLGTRNLLINSKLRRDIKVGEVNRFIVYSLSQPLIKGKEYTLGFKYTTLKGDTLNKISIRAWNPLGGTWTFTAPQNELVTFTFIPTAESKELIVYTAEINSSTVASTDIEIREAILVEGNKVGDYTEAPEDIDGKITNATTDWVKRLNDELSALKNPDSFPASAIKVEALLVDKLMSQALLSEKLVANNAFVNSLMANAIVTQKIQTTNIDLNKATVSGSSEGETTVLSGGKIRSTGTFTRTFPEGSATYESYTESWNGTYRSGLISKTSGGKKQTGITRWLSLNDKSVTTQREIHSASPDKNGARFIDFFAEETYGSDVTGQGMHIYSGQALKIESEYGLYLNANKRFYIRTEDSGLEINKDGQNLVLKRTTPYNSTAGSGGSYMSIQSSDGVEQGHVGILSNNRHLSLKSSYGEVLLKGSKVFALDADGVNRVQMYAQYFSGEKIIGNIEASESNIYAMCHDELRVVSKAGYNGGNITYKNLRFGSWNAMSHEKYKHDIREWDYNVLDVYRNDLLLHSYKVNSEKDSLYYRIHHGIILRENPNLDQFPVEWRNGDGFDGNEVLWWNTKATQELAYENTDLKNKVNDLEDRLKLLEEKLNEPTTT